MSVDSSIPPPYKPRGFLEGPPLSKFALEKIAEALPDALVERYVDRAQDAWGIVRAEAIVEVGRVLKTHPELDFRLFVSMDAVDRLLLPVKTPRFEIIYLLRSLKRGGEVARLKVLVPEEPAVLPSLVSVYQGADWWERLIWDFYGVRFQGHPDLRRVLLYEEFKGHPLRKDYPLRERQPLIPERPIQDIFRGPGTSGVS